MAWYYAVAERDHDIQNPTSAEKIRLMGEWLRLGPDTRVLDVACGKCGPALVLAAAFGCKIHRGRAVLGVRGRCPRADRRSRPR